MIDSAAGDTALLQGRTGGAAPWRSASIWGSICSTGPAQGEGQPAGQELEEDQAHGVDVAAGVDGPGAAVKGRELLGGHVRQGAAHVGRKDRWPLLEVVGEVEVEQHGLAVVGEQDVGGLEIAVDDAAVMGMSEAVGEAGPQPQDGVDVGHRFDAGQRERRLASGE